MPQNPLILRAVAFGTACVLALLTGMLLAGLVEARSKAGLSAALAEESLDFVSLDTDGLLISMTGTAPTRPRALLRWQ